MQNNFGKMPLKLSVKKADHTKLRLFREPISSQFFSKKVIITLVIEDSFFFWSFYLAVLTPFRGSEVKKNGLELPAFF